jgi:hypothetical protein
LLITSTIIFIYNTLLQLFFRYDADILKFS